MITEEPIEYPEGEFTLPIFPLPDFVFFAHTRVPLHVFEPRYRAMVSEALESTRRIGLVLLKDGWQTDYYGSPPVHAYGTAGLIESSYHYEDGRYDVMLRGLVRYRILDETHEGEYRVARVIAEPEFHGQPDKISELRSDLVALSKRYLRHFPDKPEVPELETAPFDAIVNALVMALGFDSDRKQKLLGLNDLSERARAVSESMSEKLEIIDFLAPFRKTGNPTNN